MDSPVLMDRDHESVTVAWHAAPNGVCYELSMKLAEDADDGWTVLSDKLTNCFARKKNLSAGKQYCFRVRSKSRITQRWSEYSRESCVVCPLAAMTKQHEPPTLLTVDNSSITVSWQQVPNCTGYQLQYRADDSSTNSTSTSALTWNTIPTTITGLNAKKKNLLTGVHYYFKVRPISFSDNGSSSGSSDWAFSKSSEPFTVTTHPPLAENVRSFMPRTLIARNPTNMSLTTVSSADAVAGKVIAIYFSAHWCSPCRQFTPMLAQVYLEAKKRQLPFEVVFCSADHNEREFKDYYTQNMPWMAIDYDDDQRERIISAFKVDGIPKLLIVSSIDGHVIVPNAVAIGNVTVDAVGEWVKQLRS